MEPHAILGTDIMTDPLLAAMTSSGLAFGGSNSQKLANPRVVFKEHLQMNRGTGILEIKQINLGTIKLKNPESSPKNNNIAIPVKRQRESEDDEEDPDDPAEVEESSDDEDQDAKKMKEDPESVTSSEKTQHQLQRAQIQRPILPKPIADQQTKTVLIAKPESPKTPPMQMKDSASSRRRTLKLEALRNKSLNQKRFEMFKHGLVPGLIPKLLQGTRVDSFSIQVTL